jgi:hypothetical protein
VILGSWVGASSRLFALRFFKNLGWSKEFLKIRRGLDRAGYFAPQRGSFRRKQQGVGIRSAHELGLSGSPDGAAWRVVSGVVVLGSRIRSVSRAEGFGGFLGRGKTGKNTGRNPGYLRGIYPALAELQYCEMARFPGTAVCLTMGAWVERLGQAIGLEPAISDVAGPGLRVTMNARKRESRWMRL